MTAKLLSHTENKKSYKTKGKTLAQRTEESQTKPTQINLYEKWENI